MQSSLLVVQSFLDIQKLNLQNLKLQQRLLGLVWKFVGHVELLIDREDLIGKTSHHLGSKRLTIQLSSFLTLTLVQIRYSYRELEPGFDVCGFDVCGFDVCGFDVCGFDVCGFDVCGFDVCVFVMMTRESKRDLRDVFVRILHDP